MPGPKTAEEAQAWIRAAMPAGRFIPAPHFHLRMQERAIDMVDVYWAIERAIATQPYGAGVAMNSGTCWRIFGPDADQTRTIGVGFEAFSDHKKRRVILVTCFVDGE